MITAIIVGLISAIVGGGIKIWLSMRASTAEKLGQAEQKAADQGAALTASDRIAKAQAGPSGRDVTQKEINDGSF